jgi:hypothetical protein
MKLYHSRFLIQCITIIILLGLLAACSTAQATQGVISVSVLVDENQLDVTIPSGGTVQQALDTAGVSLEYLDRVEPPAYTLLADQDEVKVVRVKEEFSVEEEIIPFEKQLLQTESLPDGQTLLAQSGENGLREITYRRVYENGVEVSSYPVRSTVVSEAIPEIIMIGVQTPFVPVSLPGRLVYLLAGNAWMMEQTSGNRKAIVVTGDLDGRVFSLSEDGSQLLFTRRSSEEGQINSLWVADISADPIALYDLKIYNIVHFAEWLPDPKNDKIIFSTVEPRPTAPGWQANNDLNVISFSPSGWVSRWKVYVDANSGGVYGWWGTDYILEPGGERVAYARPDGIGFVNMEDGSLIPLMDIVPVQTGGDWAWIPGFSWSPDGKTIYAVDHANPSGSNQPEESTFFDVGAILLDGVSYIPMVPQTGMFAYPSASPALSQPSGENDYLVAYLQAIFPNQSDTSRYRLVVMDRDGSDQRVLYPSEGEPGLEPQEPVWSPEALSNTGRNSIAVINQGNLWLVDSAGLDSPRQITGDGLVTRVDWK